MFFQACFLILASFAASANDLTIDPNFLREKLSQLSGELPVELEGTTVRITERRSSTNRRLARLFLAREYAAIGFQTTLQQYDTDGVNLVAEKPGALPGQFLLLTAHLDSVGNPGADDNGSGTISALAIAKALSRIPTQIGILSSQYDAIPRVNSRTCRVAPKGGIADTGHTQFQIGVDGSDGDSKLIKSRSVFVRS
jgi:hypothetical protein